MPSNSLRLAAKIVSEGNGPCASMPSALGRFDAGADLVDLLAAEVAVLAAVRVERGHADARSSVPGALERLVEQLDRRGHARSRDVGGHLRQRDVRGHTRRRELLEHVELARHTRVAEFVCEPAQLVLVIHAGQLQAGLVERREDDRVDPAGVGHAERAGELVDGACTGLHAHLLGRDRLAGQRVVSEQCRVAVRRGVGEGNLDTGDLRGGRQLGGVCQHVDVGLRGGLGAGEQLCRELGPDAGRVAEGKCDAGAAGGHDAATS